MVINMIKKKIFILRYIDILRELLENSLPEEDTLTDMCEKANMLVKQYIKKGDI